ncbi:hypothetical protein [Kitasatospora sp. NPDC057015]|uniref:hypothetical protein n=1 Tax=Kitasatospora sp. NPDC057015 TaxID=3346001 RepID=UPI003642B130
MFLTSSPVQPSAVDPRAIHHEQPHVRLLQQGRRQDGCSPWLVTLSMRNPDRRRGTHSFVEWARTSGEALDAALLRARSPEAVRHRRDAVLVLPDGVPDQRGLYGRA